jgi:hypothetical protein
MRTAVVVVALAMMSSCSPDGPNDVAVVSEPPASEPEQVDVLQPLLGAVRQVQVEEECRQLIALEAHLQTLQQLYTERHPEVVAARNEIARVRTGLPADGTFCSPNSDQQRQRPRAVEELRR